MAIVINEILEPTGTPTPENAAKFAQEAGRFSASKILIKELHELGISDDFTVTISVDDAGKVGFTLTPPDREVNAKLKAFLK